MPEPIRLLPFALALSVMLGPLPAQHDDVLPSEHVRQVPPGGFVDLDTGLLLPQPRFQAFQADLVFGRDGAGFYLEPLHGGAPARAGAVEPPPELSNERVRIAPHHEGTLALFAKTDRGVARVELMVADPYSTASASLRWVVVPPKQPRFLAPPRALRASWHGAQLHVEWDGDQPRWLVEVRTGDAVRKLTSERPRVAIGELDRAARHVVRVRGLTADNDVSMPADVVQWGPRQVPAAGVVSYPGRWFDTNGGLALSTGEAAVERAEVVFYLYGVFVPGGGVARVGRGERDFAKLYALPAGPFAPVYGRLDDGDVLVVRLADGRYGKLWLHPRDGSDVRSGMDVHFVFLPDGRRDLLPAPDAITVERTAAGATLAWAPAVGAVRYEVTPAAGGKAIECKEPKLALTALAPERAHEVEVVAIGADGERSGAARATVLTHTGDVRHGRLQLESQNGGYVFATGARVKYGEPCDVALNGGAGNYNSMYFEGTALAAGAGHAFGELPDVERLELVTRWVSDDRRPDHDRFYVRTRDGGLASVRILRRDARAELEFVWRPGR